MQTTYDKLRDKGFVVLAINELEDEAKVREHIKEELSLSRTPVVRRVASAFFAIEYGFAVGTIMSPDAIGLGVRTMYSEFEFPDGTTETDIIHFYNDPSGSPACAG